MSFLLVFLAFASTSACFADRNGHPFNQSVSTARVLSQVRWHSTHNLAMQLLILSSSYFDICLTYICMYIYLSLSHFTIILSLLFSIVIGVDSSRSHRRSTRDNSIVAFVLCLSSFSSQ